MGSFPFPSPAPSSPRSSLSWTRFVEHFGGGSEACVIMGETRYMTRPEGCVLALLDGPLQVVTHALAALARLRQHGRTVRGGGDSGEGEEGGTGGGVASTQAEMNRRGPASDAKRQRKA